jgi:hypothetical protein
MKTRLTHMLADVRDTLAAIARAKRGQVIELCGCGCVTVRRPCPRCRRKANDQAHAPATKNL